LKTLLVIIVSGWLLPLPVLADRDAEREALTQLAYELKVLQPIIDRAELNTNQDARPRTIYYWLRQDLDLIRTGIHDLLEPPRQQPRKIPALKGDYRE
jgi:RAQPRD family integrative conjugative element protein